jgi:HTH-type transcriptional regulator/antitoxin HigA
MVSGTTMPEAAEFEPDWFSPPGAAIAERLRRSEKPFADFLFEMDLHQDDAKRLLEGRLEITEAIACRLEKALGVTATFWLAREAQYRRDMVRIAEGIPSDAAREWLGQLPMKDMMDFGWIETHTEITKKVAECLRYFDIPSIDAFNRHLQNTVGNARLRTSQTFRSKPATLAAWIRRGELEAEKISCKPWDKAKFQSSLDDIRKLTLIRDPKNFLPKLTAVCASCGVALVIARAPSGCRASGATKFLPDNKALLLLSFRHLSDDHFWFSFFHEAGHLILHGEETTFIEGEFSDDSAQEQEANAFAEKTLIPEPWNRLLEKLPPNRKEITRFAVRAGVSPGIVVGQLQHKKRIAHNFLNYLKRRFVWI